MRLLVESWEEHEDCTVIGLSWFKLDQIGLLYNGIQIGKLDTIHSIYLQWLLERGLVGPCSTMSMVLSDEN